MIHYSPTRYVAPPRAPFGDATRHTHHRRPPDRRPSLLSGRGSGPGPGRTTASARAHAAAHTRRICTIPRPHGPPRHAPQPLKHGFMRTSPLGVTSAAARRARRFGATSAIDEPEPPSEAKEDVVVARHMDRRVHVCETHEPRSSPRQPTSFRSFCRSTRPPAAAPSGPILLPRTIGRNPTVLA